MWPGLGSSSSSTSPSALWGIPSGIGSTGPPASIAFSASGEGGGLRDLERLASSCKKGMGENRGVVGTVRMVPLSEMDVVLGPLLFDSMGKEFQLDVTRSVFSTALRYFPRAR